MSYLVKNPKDRFSRDEAPFKFTYTANQSATDDVSRFCKIKFLSFHVKESFSHYRVTPFFAVSLSR